MDLKAYYRQLREVEEKLPEPCVIVSMATADGGKAGVKTEAPRKVAARLIVSRTARAATPAETRAFQEKSEEARLAAEQMAAASRMQVTVIPTRELRNLVSSKE
jgi:hypothetical protein